MRVSKQQLKQIIEGALLAIGQPMSRDKMQSLFVDEDEIPSKDDLNEALLDIQKSCEGRGFELKEVASGWRFQVREEMAPWVNRLWDEKPQKYSRALLETLALIAYRQPITRGDIEEIRGVAVSSHIVKTLVEREWIKVVGHRDVPGRPSLYATTRQFLDYFDLRSLEGLPSLGEIADIEALEAQLNLAPAIEDTELEATEATEAEVEEVEEAEEAEESAESEEQAELEEPAVIKSPADLLAEAAAEMLDDEIDAEQEHSSLLESEIVDVTEESTDLEEADDLEEDVSWVDSVEPSTDPASLFSQAPVSWPVDTAEDEHETTDGDEQSLPANETPEQG